MGTRSPDKLPSLSRRARRLMILGLGLIVLMVVGPRLVDITSIGCGSVRSVSAECGLPCC